MRPLHYYYDGVLERIEKPRNDRIVEPVVYSRPYDVAVGFVGLYRIVYDEHVAPVSRDGASGSRRQVLSSRHVFPQSLGVRVLSDLRCPRENVTEYAGPVIIPRLGSVSLRKRRGISRGYELQRRIVSHRPYRKALRDYLGLSASGRDVDDEPRAFTLQYELQLFLDRVVMPVVVERLSLLFLKEIPNERHERAALVLMSPFELADRQLRYCAFLFPHGFCSYFFFFFFACENAIATACICFASSNGIPRFFAIVSIPFSRASPGSEDTSSRMFRPMVFLLFPFSRGMLFFLGDKLRLRHLLLVCLFGFLLQSCTFRFPFHFPLEIHGRFPRGP